MNEGEIRMSQFGASASPTPPIQDDELQFTLTQADTSPIATLSTTSFLPSLSGH